MAGGPVLVVEDEQCIRDVLVELFEAGGNRTIGAATLADATAALGAEPFELIVTDLRLGPRHDGGLQVVAAAGLLSPQATVVVLTAFPGEDNRAAAHRLGATYFLEKPVDLGVIAALARQHHVSTPLMNGEVQ